jgi:predicted nucleic acid-binding protein
MSADFYDSNLFVYLFDETAPAKQQRADALIRTALEEQTGCISFQVVQETLNVLTRKLARPLTPADAEVFMQLILMPLWTVMPSAALYSKAIELQGRSAIGFYDALIVAAALQAGSTRLLSEDLQHGQMFGALRVENPFRT